MAKDKTKQKAAPPKEQTAMAYVGSSGIGSGPHLDLRGYTTQDRAERMSEERLRQIAAMLRAGEKYVSEYPVTSGYGPRKAPVPGASTYHYALDYGIPPGTPIRYEGEYIDLQHRPNLGKAGNVTEMFLPTGEIVQFLHLDRFGNLVGPPPVKLTPAQVPQELAQFQMPIERPAATLGAPVQLPPWAFQTLRTNAETSQQQPASYSFLDVLKDAFGV